MAASIGAFQPGGMDIGAFQKSATASNVTASALITEEDDTSTAIATTSVLASSSLLEEDDVSIGSGTITVFRAAWAASCNTLIKVT